MKVLVYCANGLQGQPVVRQLLRSRHQVRALVRDVDRAAALHADGAEVVSADLDSEDLTNLEQAHKDVEFVVFTLPSGSTSPRVAQGRRAVECIRRTKSIRGVIFNPSVQYPRHIEELPPFAATREVEGDLRRSAIPFSVVRPTFYLQNLLLPYAAMSIAMRDTLVYPVAEQRPLAWVAVEDIARLIAHLIRSEAMGVSVEAGGRRTLTGTELAERFSQGLGRRIRYQSLGLDEFEAAIDAAVGPGVGKRISAIFRFIERHPDDLGFVSRPFAQPDGVPAFEMTDVTEWVAEHRATFSGQAELAPISS